MLIGSPGLSSPARSFSCSPAVSSRVPVRAWPCPTGRRATAGACSRSRPPCGSAGSSTSTVIASSRALSVFLTIVLAVWLWLADPRRWMKRLGAIALGTVILQGVLGGLTVLFFLPTVHLHCTRRSRRAVLLHHGRDRRLQLPGLAQRRDATGRPWHSGVRLW